MLIVLIAKGSALNSGRIQFIVFTPIFLGIITSVISAVYYLLKKDKILKSEWIWKGIVLLPLTIPLKMIPTQFELMLDNKFIEEGIVVIIQCSLVALLTIVNYRKLSVRVKQMLTQ